MESSDRDTATPSADEDSEAALGILPAALDNPLECDTTREAPIVCLLKKLYTSPKFAQALEDLIGR